MLKTYKMHTIFVQRRASVGAIEFTELAEDVRCWELKKELRIPTKDIRKLYQKKRYIYLIHLDTLWGKK